MYVRVTESFASDVVFPLSFKAITTSFPACSGPVFSINKLKRPSGSWVIFTFSPSTINGLSFIVLYVRQLISISKTNDNL